MQYTQKSFTVPPASLPTGKNAHGQTWEDIFGPPTPEDIKAALRSIAAEMRCLVCDERPVDCQCFNVSTAVSHAIEWAEHD